MVGADGHRPGKAGDVLQVIRQFADEGYAGHRQQFAHLLKTDRIPSLGHFRGHRNALHHLRFTLHGVINAQGVEQRRADIASAGAVGVRDRWRRQQRRPQLVCAVDSRQRRPRLHHHADRRVGQLPARIRLRTARFLEAGQRVPDHDHHVRVFAARQTVRDRLRRFSHRRARDHHEVVAGLFFPRRGQLFQRRFEAAGDHHGDLSGQRAAAGDGQQQRG